MGYERTDAKGDTKGSNNRGEDVSLVAFLVETIYQLVFTLSTSKKRQKKAKRLGQNDGTTDTKDLEYLDLARLAV